MCVVYRWIAFFGLAAGLVACGDEARQGIPDAPDAGEPAARQAAWLVAPLPGFQPLEAQSVGSEGSLYMPEIMGPGIAVVDFDRDGDLDLFMPDFGPNREARPPRLYRRESDGRYTEVAASAGLTAADFGQGVLVFDFDSDGWPDVFQTNVGPNRLWRNLGTGRFEDVTATAGLGGGDAWSASAVAADLDGDGDLDLFVTNYVALDPDKVCDGSGGRADFCGPRVFEGVHDLLYINRGDGSFEDASERLGVRAGKARRGLGVIAEDLTGDGRVDLYVANDNDPNQLWVQREDGRFTEDGMLRGAALNEDGREEASMGIVVEDLDADGDLDLFLTHLNGETNTLYAQGPAGEFRERTQASGLGALSLEFTAFGAVAFDLDGDGDLDLATVNGHVFRSSVREGAAMGPFWNRYAQPGQLALNQGQGRFQSAPAEGGEFATSAIVGRGLATGDLDGDGLVDLVASGAALPPRIWLNRAPQAGSWLRVRVAADATGRPALGAVVTVTAGSQSWSRRIRRAGSYLSSSEPVANFALPEDRFDKLSVRWPGGHQMDYPGGAARRTIDLAP